jgi:hypothetical protein
MLNMYVIIVSQALIRPAFWTMVMRQNKNRLEVAAVIGVFVAGALIFMSSRKDVHIPCRSSF